MPNRSAGTSAASASSKPAKRQSGCSLICCHRRPRRVLDLGCGDGRLTALVLKERPSIEQAVAVDRSEPMLTHARDRFADDTRVEIRDWDLNDDITPLGTFDVIVSGFAIHHLEHRRKRALFR
jgi:ubiquinone/menaquinone biosynthesis C-methylase UbiE